MANDARHPGWPATLAAGAVELRGPRRGDARAWSDTRMSNRQWLERWEPTSGLPWHQRSSPASGRLLVRNLRRSAAAGTGLPFMIVYGGRVVGQCNVSNVIRGVLQSATIGYWIDQAVAGRGIMPTAVALAVDHCFAAVGLHRIEVGIRPENGPSLQVVRKLGLRQEGYYERFLNIDGAWRDHVAFAITVEELAGTTLLSRLGRLPAAP